ncbi:MAG: hypothetical protein WCG87_02865 [Bacteroidota bacterium]
MEKVAKKGRAYNVNTSKNKFDGPGFSYSVVVNDDSTELLKAHFTQLVHYGYNDKNVNKPNSELIIVDMYYRNNELFVADIHSEYYDSTKTYYTTDNRYIINEQAENLYLSSTNRETFSFLMNTNNNVKSVYKKHLTPVSKMTQKKQ